MLSIIKCALLLCASLATAARLTVSISSSALLPNPATLPPSTHAVLIGPLGVRYDVPLRRDNSFAFPDLAEASYLLNIHSRDYFFAPLRVDVTGPADGLQQESMQAWQTFRGNEWSNKGQHYGTGKGELKVQVSPSGSKEYYLERGGFNLMGMLKSPMILMGLVSVVMIVGVPYMMENMDPEMKEEMMEMQKKGPLTGQDGAASAIQNFDLAGFLAGRGSSGTADSGSSGGGRKR